MKKLSQQAESRLFKAKKIHYASSSITIVEFSKTMSTSSNSLSHPVAKLQLSSVAAIYLLRFLGSVFLTSVYVPVRFCVFLPFEQRFFSRMAFCVYEVVRLRQTSHANDFVNAESHAREKLLLAGQCFLSYRARTNTVMCSLYIYTSHYKVFIFIESRHRKANRHNLFRH